MSINNWIGGLIRKTPPTPSGPYQNSTAPGIWTLTQVANYIKQGIWPTAGNTNPDAFIENLFSTYLYTGNGTSQTITNGIDLSTKGGLVWFKTRNQAFNHALYDTARGTSGGYGLGLISNSTSAQVTGSGNYLTTFNSNGFTTSANGSTSGDNWVAWTFRKQAKFFDVVTYTGNGNNRTISHNLGSTPGCIIVKKSSGDGPWPVYHRSLTDASTSYVNLNETSARGVAATYWNSTAPTSTVFSIGTSNDVNQSGETYVAYLFAHDAGGFGLTGTDNVISCGSFTGNGSAGQQITLGYEPQFIILKQTNAADTWRMYDNMRGMGVGGSSVTLQPNSSNNESTDNYPYINATGFTTGAITSGTYIYIAIRRGPMKTPTSGTSVFAPVAYTGNGSTQVLTTNFPADMYWNKTKSVGPGSLMDRMRGQAVLRTEETLSEASIGTYSSTTTVWQNNTGLSFGASGADGLNENGIAVGLEAFGRAPGFMDVVCYSGSSSNQNISHNLAVVPELIIIKARNSAQSWPVYSATLGTGQRLFLNGNSGAGSTTNWPSAPTASVFSVEGGVSVVNASGVNYVAYLFATCPGVSKVGSYTGTGTTLQIDCGFTSGARFVLIKRTDSTGGWYVWDSARGIVAGNDPYLLLNSSAAEVTNTDYVDTYSAGFEISSTAPAAINANGGTFIFLAIA